MCSYILTQDSAICIHTLKQSQQHPMCGVVPLINAIIKQTALRMYAPKSKLHLWIYYVHKVSQRKHQTPKQNSFNCNMWTLMFQSVQFMSYRFCVHSRSEALRCKCKQKHTNQTQQVPKCINCALKQHTLKQQVPSCSTYSQATHSQATNSKM